MELTKFILMFCSLLVAYCEGDESTTVTEAQDQFDETTVSSDRSQNYGYFRRVNQLTNNLRQCFCFLQKSTGVPVTQRLNPRGEKLERLIIYVYKDASSGGFKLYVPNHEKQQMIPDLAIDQGDILETWPSFEIEPIFNKYPNLKTDRNINVITDVAQVIDRDNFDIPSNHEEELSPDYVELTPSSDNNAISTIGQEINPYPESITPDNQMKEDIDSNVYEDLSNTPSINPDMHILPENIDDNTVDSNPNQELQNPNTVLDDMNLEGKSMKVIQINQNFDVKPKPGDINKITPDNTAFPNSDNNVNININLDLSNLDEQSERPSKVDVTQPDVPDLNEDVENPVKHENVITWPESTYPNVVSVPTNPYIWDTVKPQYIPTRTIIKKIIKYVPEQNIIDTIPSEGPKIWKHIYEPNKGKIVTLHPQRLIQRYPQERNINLETFDNWLVHQLEKVQFAESEAANSVDIYTLKYLIEKTLRKSGFFIATNGLLVDSKGVKIKMANLVLRPILIGDSVEYKNLLKGKIGAFKLPTDLPYLEAVLITSIKPQKILGIVPLGKTYLPNDYRTPLSLYVPDSQEGGCNKCKVNRVQADQFYHTDLVPSRVEEFIHRHPSRWITTNYGPYSKKQRYGVKRPGQASEPYTFQRDGLVEGTRRASPVDHINTFIDKLYKEPAVDNVNYVQRPYVVDYNVQPVVTKETYHTVPIGKYPFDMVTPGYRIIGGNAATSSGTPVSSKGRSGIRTEEVIPADEE